MNHVQRALRALMHFNIGATLAVAAWLVWASSAVAFEPPSHEAPASQTQAHPVGACDCRAAESSIAVQRPSGERLAGTTRTVANR